MRLPLARAALLVALALAPRLAAADVTDANQATARALTLEGYEALDRKDYTTAADRFTRADTLYHVPTVTLGLAHAQVGLGKLVAALATYSRIVREGAPPSSPPAFVKAVEDARRAIEPLTQRIPNVIVTVSGPSSASVTIDGVEVPAAALGVKRPVDPGSHVVRASAPGFITTEAKVSVLEGKVEPVSLTLKPDPAAVAPPASTAPPPAATVKPPPIAPPPATPPPEEGTGTQRLLAYVGLGVGAAGIGLGAITGGLALSKHSSLLESCPGGHCKPSQKDALQGDVDSYKTMGTLSTVGFIAGGAAAGAGVILLLTAPRSAPSSKTAVTPLLGPGYAGLTGRF